MSKEMIEQWELYKKTADYMQRSSAIANGMSNGNIFEHFMDWLTTK